MGMKGAGRALAKVIAEGRVPKPREEPVAMTTTDVGDEADWRTVSAGRLHLVYCALYDHQIEPRRVSITVPEKDFIALGEFECEILASDKSRLHMFGIEILRGADEVIVWLPGEMVKSDGMALEAEILRCLGRGSVAKLPKSASSNGVSPSAKTIGEVGVAARAAGRDNRDSNRTAHLSHEAKIIAAKHAIAVYAREKKLPSAEMLATFGELDRAKVGGGSAGVDMDFAEADSIIRTALARRGAPANINRHAHRLSSESLSRAADQIWGANSGGAYADLVCSRAERLAEMVYRGDSAADRERG